MPLSPPPRRYAAAEILRRPDLALAPSIELRLGRFGVTQVNCTQPRIYRIHVLMVEFVTVHLVGVQRWLEATSRKGTKKQPTTYRTS
eukprot:COSAG02_NODE_46242_length_350_cov_1.139442_1_plen_87_part_00